MADGIQQERELRELWERLHMEFHAQLRQELDKAAIFIAAKLAEMNEVRNQINTERAIYPTREYVDAVFSSIDTRLKALEQSKSYLIGWAAAAMLGIMLLVKFWGK